MRIYPNGMHVITLLNVRRITKRAMYTHDNYTFPEQTTAYVVLQHIPGAESVGYILSDTL